jgi:hypothetical protein
VVSRLLQLSRPILTGASPQSLPIESPLAPVANGRLLSWRARKRGVPAKRRGTGWRQMSQWPGSLRNRLRWPGQGWEALGGR